MASLVIVCTVVIGPVRGAEFRAHRYANLCVASPDTSLSRVGQAKMIRGSEVALVFNPQTLADPAEV